VRKLLVETQKLCNESQKMLADTVSHDLTELLACTTMPGSCDSNDVEQELQGLRDAAHFLQEPIRSIRAAADAICDRIHRGAAARETRTAGRGRGCQPKAGCSIGVLAWLGAETTHFLTSPDHLSLGKMEANEWTRVAATERMHEVAAAERMYERLSSTQVPDTRGGRRKAEDNLQVCHRLCSAAGVAIESLSAAGSGLQRVMSTSPCDLGTDFASLVGHKEPVVANLARCLLASLQSVSVALVELAASLSMEVRQPLEAFHRATCSRLASRQADIDQVCRRRRVYTDAITASLQRSEALATQAQLAQQCTNPTSPGFLSWFSTLSGPSHQPEAVIRRLQRKEQRLVEEKQGQILQLTQAEQVNTIALGEDFERVEGAMKEVLQGTFSHFPSSWAKVADGMRLELCSLTDST